MKNKFDYKGILIFSGVVFLFVVLVTAFAWIKIPSDAQIPFHWNIKGEVDNYTSKSLGLLMGPGMIIFLTLLLAFIPRFEPRLENLQQSQKAYKAVWGGLLVFMAALHVITTLAALGQEKYMPTMMAFLMGFLFIAIGNYLGKIRSNFMFGIRTPWTLSSELAWNKTHRLGGWLFFGIGLVTFLSGFFRSGELTFGLLFGGLFLSLPILFGYSYWIWKQDKRE
ncbi:MAG: DUF1648 domain-containing protein [Chloroflexi bacterium]|nr:DUF1648 domain-containing protein [Chloroflexota bacterium]